MTETEDMIVEALVRGMTDRGLFILSEMIKSEKLADEFLECIQLEARHRMQTEGNLN